MTKNTDTRFAFVPSDDPEMTDDEYQLLLGPSHFEISVQVCAYGGRTTYAVNKYYLDDPEDDASLVVQDCGHFRTLKAAQAKALEVAVEV